MSFVRAPWAEMPFLQLLTGPSTTGHWRTWCEPCQLRKWKDASLEGCRPPSSPAAEEHASYVSTAQDVIFDHSCSPWQCTVLYSATRTWRHFLLVLVHANVTNLKNYTCSFRQTIYTAIHHIIAQPHPQYIHESPPCTCMPLASMLNMIPLITYTILQA